MGLLTFSIVITIALLNFFLGYWLGLREKKWLEKQYQTLLELASFKASNNIAAKWEKIKLDEVPAAIKPVKKGPRGAVGEYLSESEVEKKKEDETTQMIEDMVTSNNKLVEKSGWIPIDSR